MKKNILEDPPKEEIREDITKRVDGFFSELGNDDVVAQTIESEPEMAAIKPTYQTVNPPATKDSKSPKCIAITHRKPSKGAQAIIKERQKAWTAIHEKKENEADHKDIINTHVSISMQPGDKDISR